MNDPADRQAPTTTESPSDESLYQDSVHDLVTCLRAPAVAISGGDGQLRGIGNHGFYHQDRRLLSRLLLRILDREPESIHGHPVGASAARFVGVVRRREDPGPDPTLIVERLRSASPASETVRVWNGGRDRVVLPVDLFVGTDLAEISQVSNGSPPATVVATGDVGELSWESADDLRVTLSASPPAELCDPDAGRLHWTVALAPGDSWDLALTVTPKRPDDRPTVLEPGAGSAWSSPTVRSHDPNLDQLVSRSLGDLEALTLADPEQPADRFLAAGSPWYLTLFGRDSLWAARMMLPLGTDLAAGTLRTLARRQGMRRDPATEEQPGKILHELRPATRDFASGTALPPRYYGTIDATLLFVTLLGEAWHWGMPEHEVAELLPAAERALGWLRHDATPDRDGFVKYQRTNGNGLQNQGWKDSHDAIQFADGTLAQAPIALSEVQGYAYQAALHGADLLQAFDRPGADHWRSWAAELRRRFTSAFWVEDAAGPYPAIALDAAGRAVDAPTSNMGHLLGTGILDVEGCRQVAARLGSAEMDSGWGLRTLSARAAGFNPLSYHGGSVWPHDTAIAVAGLAATGHTDEATAILSGMLAAAPSFGYRLPELYAGEQRRPDLLPIPYPAACRPQAWSAASSVSLVQSILGLRPDVPAGRISLRPLHGALPGGLLDVKGLRVAGRSISVRVQDGSVQVEGTGNLEVQVD